MNYLAHAFLSFNQPEITVGNMISDFIKGKKKFEFSEGIQRGIALHRAIDEFTDYHSATARAKQYFRPAYRLYAAPFIDIVYDHFLANDNTEFSYPHQLAAFAEATYQNLSEHETVLPADFKMMLPFMKKHNWLYNYQFREGMQRSFAGLVRRAKYIHESDTAFAIFEKHYQELKQCYADFFPELKDFAFHHLQLLQRN